MIFFNTEAAITAYEETTRGFRLDHYDYRVVPVAMDRNNTSYYCRHDLHGNLPVPVSDREYRVSVFTCSSTMVYHKNNNIKPCLHLWLKTQQNSGILFSRRAETLFPCDQQPVFGP